MFSTIVLGTSLSETSTRTLCCLRGMREVGVQTIVLIHAMNIRDVGTLYRQLKNLAQPMLEHQQQLLQEMGFEVEAEIRLGLPFYEIQQVAKEREASLIAVHLTTESLLGAAFIGDVAYEVIQRADRPVLAMKADISDHGCEVLCENVLRHILFPTDFSENAERALTLLEQIVDAAQSAVTLIHVREEIGNADQNEQQVEAARHRMEAIASRLQQHGSRSVKIELREGSPTAEILTITQQHEHSLIVMGSQGAGFIKEVFLGSVSHNLVRHARVPVLLVPSLRD